MLAVATVLHAAILVDTVPSHRLIAVQQTTRANIDMFIDKLPQWVPRWRLSMPGMLLKQRESHDAWLGHWLLESSEDAKAEAVMRKEGVPFLARRVAMSFKSERRFFMHGETLVGEVKTLTGGWSEMSTLRATHFRSPGYRTRSTTSWKGNMLCTRTVVDGPLGRSETTTRHYIDGDLRLVSETKSPGGTYKTYFVKADDGTTRRAPHAGSATSLVESSARDV